MCEVCQTATCTLENFVEYSTWTDTWTCIYFSHCYCALHVWHSKSRRSCTWLTKTNESNRIGLSYHNSELAEFSQIFRKMNTGDSFKVWETKALRRSGEGEAKRILDRIAKQVQPIMRRRMWKVKLLSEMQLNLFNFSMFIYLIEVGEVVDWRTSCSSKNALGSNLGAGLRIKLQLRKLNRDQEFLPFDEVLDTMLHELCHNDIARHDAKFYKLWKELIEVFFFFFIPSCSSVPFSCTLLKVFAYFTHL